MVSFFVIKRRAIEKISFRCIMDLSQKRRYLNFKKEKEMNVTIESSCIACGACESICDAVFSIEDIAVVNAANVEANADAVNEAAAACPVSAITVA